MSVANSFYMDASAHAKRYVPEKGSAQIDAILGTLPRSRIYMLNIGIGEILSILVRKRNAGLLSISDLGQAVASFNAEIVRGAAVTRASVTSRLVTASLRFVVAHSINSTDALTLESALAIARRLRRAGDDLVVVASDQRLLRAAQSEGLATFNPEIQDQAALANLMGP
jgi:predicted nucleic acid-binding protein